MAGKDKHPPMNYSTNKRVKPSTTKMPGAPYKTAAGSKRVKPGDGSTTSAKTAKPYVTAGMEVKRAIKSGVLTPDTMQKAKTLRKYRKAQPI